MTIGGVDRRYEALLAPPADGAVPDPAELGRDGLPAALAEPEERDGARGIWDVVRRIRGCMAGIGRDRVGRT